MEKQPRKSLHMWHSDISDEDVRSDFCLQTMPPAIIRRLSLELVSEAAIEARRMVVTNQRRDFFDRQLGLSQKIGGFVQPCIPQKAVQVDAYLEPEQVTEARAAEVHQLGKLHDSF